MKSDIHEFMEELLSFSQFLAVNHAEAGLFSTVAKMTDSYHTSIVSLTKNDRRSYGSPSTGNLRHRHDLHSPSKAAKLCHLGCIRKPKPHHGNELSFEFQIPT